jgi:hypothetical protein
MIKISGISFLFITSAFCVLAQNDLSGKCEFYDTTFYYRQTIGGEREALYPLKVVCYFSDSLGNKTNKKCRVEKFIKGIRGGAELSYYYSEQMYLVNWSGRRIKRAVSHWRRKYLLTELPSYSLQYKGYWKNGEKHGLWTYYTREGIIVLVEEYDNGVFLRAR